MQRLIIIIAFTTLLVSCGSKDKQTDTNTSKQADTSNLQPNLIVAVGKVEPEDEIVDLSASLGGIVKNVFKKDGDSVSKGELLVQLDDDIEQNKLSEIRTQMQTQRSQVNVEQTQLKEAQANIDNKKSLLAKTKRLLDNGAETQQVYDDLVNDLKLLEISTERSKAKISFANNQLNELTAQLRTAETEAQKKKFTSPFGGVMLDMQLNKGEAVNQFATFAQIAPKGNLIVRAEVDEMFSPKVKTGQQVDIVNTGSDKVIATGEISLVSPYLKKKSLFSEKASDQEDRRVREIRILLKVAGSLIINAKVECKIKL